MLLQTLALRISGWSDTGRPLSFLMLILSAGFIFLPSIATAHNVAGSDQAFLENNIGSHLIAYLYLGAKHMITGYDHLLYLAGVIFFLFRLRDVAVFVSLFAFGHSITLLVGVLAGWHVNVYIVDAVIGLSVVYKGFENLGGFRALFTKWFDARIAVFLFGLVHGLGLASKLQDLSLAQDGLVVNMLAFNVGVEIGQLLALTILMLTFNLLRRSAQFHNSAAFVNSLLMVAGFILIGYQITGYLTT